MKKFEICPVCEFDVATGSHWDCVFSLLEEWVVHRKKEEPEVKPVAGEDLRVELGEGAAAPALAPASSSKPEEGVTNG